MRSIIFDEFGDEKRIVRAVIPELARIPTVQRKVGETLQKRDSQTVHAEMGCERIFDGPLEDGLTDCD